MSFYKNLTRAIVLTSLLMAATGRAATTGTEAGAFGNQWGQTASTIGTWSFDLVADSLAYIGNSNQGNRASIGAYAFNLQPGLAGDYANATFRLNGGALSIGQSFSLQANYLWNGGVRGVEFLSGTSGLFRFEHGDADPATGNTDQIFLKGQGLTDTVVSANAYQRAFNYQVTRTTSGLDIFAGENGGSAMKIATLGALEIDGLKLYVGGITTSAADQPNFGLFANNLAVIPEPSSAGLLLTGLASWLACRRRRISS